MFNTCLHYTLLNKQKKEQCNMLYFRGPLLRAEWEGDSLYLLNERAEKWSPSFDHILFLLMRKLKGLNS